VRYLYMIGLLVDVGILTDISYICTMVLPTLIAILHVSDPQRASIIAAVLLYFPTIFEVYPYLIKLSYEYDYLSLKEVLLLTLKIGPLNL
jgi:hypothetical protein